MERAVHHISCCCSARQHSSTMSDPVATHGYFQKPARSSTDAVLVASFAHMHSSTYLQSAHHSSQTTVIEERSASHRPRWNPHLPRAYVAREGMHMMGASVWQETDFALLRPSFVLYDRAANVRPGVLVSRRKLTARLAHNKSCCHSG